MRAGLSGQELKLWDVDTKFTLRVKTQRRLRSLRLLREGPRYTGKNRDIREWKKDPRGAETSVLLWPDIEREREREPGYTCLQRVRWKVKNYQST